MEKQFKYDAFISYRHTELDKFVAENLHKQLEAFSLPRSVAKRRKGQKTKIERVFRDKEELPLTSNLEDPILQALHSSEWLIVICSPRLRESLWCKKEIETFVALRGRERVLAVLIEGEPAESFPDELLYKLETVTHPDGTVEEVKIPVEPLAADVRGETPKEMLKAMKTEVIRILAAMFQVSFDDLRQRHRERKMRRIMTASLIGGAACLLFGIYSTVTAIRINNQKEQIEAQSTQILQQSQEIEKQSAEILKQNAEILKQNQELAVKQARSLAERSYGYLEEGNRTGAIETAVEALTVSEGIAMPYTPEAQLVLAESLRAYDTGNTYRAEYQYETAGKIEYVKDSQDSDTLAIYDDTHTLTLFDLEKREVIDVFDESEYDYWGSNGNIFLGEDKFAYIDPEDAVCIYDLKEKAVVARLEPGAANSLTTDAEGKYLVVQKRYDIYVVYDVETLQELGRTPEQKTNVFLEGPFISTEGIMANVYPMDEQEENYVLKFTDVNTMELLSDYALGVKEPQEIQIREGVAYIISGEYDVGYTTCKAYISAISIENGALLWEHALQGVQWPKKIVLPMNEGATDLIGITNAGVSLINMQSGEISFTEGLNSTVLKVRVYPKQNSFLLFCQGGEMIVADKEYGGCIDLSYNFQCKTTINDAILPSAHGITVFGRNDNKITLYTMKTGPDVTPIQETIEYPQDQFIGGKEACEIAQNYGLEKPEFVNYLYYSPDERYCFVQYWNYSLVIYDVEAGEIRNTLENAYSTDMCLGTDAGGYTYLLGYDGCYMLNLDMVPVMWIEDVKGVDLEAQKVYLSWYDDFYEAPIYTVEELLQLAKEYN
ncbi:MAG: TIR domain-containing protein [Lachnospiraceae bacterium]|nr:TIR domain-containing protein [Lachnospiraceae bacterium]